jgi:hypothetical protein
MDTENVLHSDEELAESSTVDEGQLSENQTGDGQEGEEGQPPADDGAGASRSKGAEKRIKQLTAKWRSEEAARKAMAEENRQLAERLDALEQRIGVNARPQKIDYEDDESYEDALLEWHTSRKPKAASPPTSAPEPKPEIDPKTLDKFKASLMAIGEDSYDAVMTDDWPCNQTMSELLISSDRGAEVAVLLANDLDLSYKIHDMTPIQAARELAKLEAGLPAKTKPRAATTPLPPPGKPVRPGANPVIDQDKLSADEWARRRRAGEF